MVPLFLDLLRIIQLAPPSVYERALPTFIKGLSMLGMDYTDAYHLHLNTLIYLHKIPRNVYHALLRNANRALVTTDIGFMHRLLAGMTSNQATQAGKDSTQPLVNCLSLRPRRSSIIRTVRCSRNKPRA